MKIDLACYTRGKISLGIIYKNTHNFIREFSNFDRSIYVSIYIYNRTSIIRASINRASHRYAFLSTFSVWAEL
jgi:hypothetical protein